jgi:hypothetical protein
MNDAEVIQIAGVLLDCTYTLHEEGDIQELLFYLNRLWQVISEMIDASPCRSNRAERFTLAMLMKMARRRRRQLEDQLGVRN